MAKRSASKRSGKYADFKLHGSYPKQKVLMYIVLDCIISLSLGILLQPLIVRTVASAFAAY